MTEEGQIYLCEICGNKVEVIAAGAGTLVCCGQPMTLVK
ncbi:MAG: desulfoferrodoxin FeS4 iron-binding domain-containing protein [Candidatus Bathyarchaeota archaeon]